MKFTPSKDGHLRLDLTVKFRVGLETMVNGALRDDDVYAPTSRAKWIKAVKRSLNRDGEAVWAGVEHVTSDKRADFTRRCLLLFHELKSQSTL